MMNEFQRRILAEAAKFGGSSISKNEQMAKTINEAPLFATGGGSGSMFGYSKQQFEAKMRQLIQKMGFEKGINKMEVSDKKMMLYFANAAKARDFIITFNGLTKRQSTGSPASINTSFDKVKAPAGTNAIVTVDFSMLKTEGLDKESHMFLMLESLHEQYLAEGAVKAAMEDWVEGLSKAVVAEIRRKYGAKLKAAEMNGLSKSDPVRKELKQLLDKNKVAPAMGDKSRESDIAALEMMFNTFHGESVEFAEATDTHQFRVGDAVQTMVNGKPRRGVVVKVGSETLMVNVGSNPRYDIAKHKSEVKYLGVKEEAEEIEEGVRVMTGAEKMIKDDPIGGSSMVSSFRRIKKSLEGKPTGSVLVVMKENDPESMDVKIYEPSAFKSLVNGLSKKAEAKVGSKGSWSGGEITVVAIKESVDIEEATVGYALVVNNKIVYRGNKQSCLKLAKEKHGGLKQGKVFITYTPKEVGDTFAKEEVEFTEAKEKFLTGPGKKDPKRLLGVYNMKGKWIKDMNSEAEAKAFVNKSWGESVEEEVEQIDEVWWKGSDPLTKADADGLLDDLEKAYEKGGLNGTMKVPNGDSGPVWEMIDGLRDFLRGEPKNMVAYVLKGVRDFLKPEDRNNSKIKAVFESVEEDVEEAYAPLDTPNLVGAFTETSKKKRFEYRKSTDKWGISHGLPHEVCVKETSPSEWRAANVKGTVCYIATDEGEGGKPVLEKWAIKNHVKYVKAEGVEDEDEVISEIIQDKDRVPVQGSKMVYVGQSLRALQSKNMMSGSVVKGERYKVATNAKGKVDLVHQAIGYRTAVRNVDATTIEALIKDKVLT